jgi:exonuclease SbcC
VRIEVIQLENIRSHVKSTVPFARGFNCLLGGVGCGKSSILYSIDFAFFGDPIGRSFDYLLREGSTNGKVVVQFVHNGKTYKISRGLKKRGEGINQDFEELKLFEEEELISSAKGDAVAEQFKAITGLDRDLFREIVWVRQEHLKELLNSPPRERQKRLDELFGLAEYEVAWSSLAGYQRDYEGEKRAYEKDADVVNMEKLGIEYNRIAEDFSLVEVELQDMAQRLLSAKKALEEADLKLQKMEETRKQNEELKRKETRAHANLVNVQDSAASLSEKVNGKKMGLESLKKRLTSMEAQLDSYSIELKKLGFPSDQPLEALRRHIAALDDQLSSLKGEQEVALRNIQLDEGRTSSISSENRCPLCLQPLTEEYKIELAERIQAENDERKKTASQLRTKIERLQQLKNTANNAFSTLQMLSPIAEELRSRIKEETDVLVEFSNELDDKQRLEKDLHAQLDTLRFELKRYDISEVETAKTRREQAFRQYYVLDSEIRAKENRKKDLTVRLDEIKERIDHAQQKIERVQKIAKAVELIGGIRDAYRSIQPKLRSEFVQVLRNFAQQVLDNLTSGEGPILNLAIDETYTPYVLSEGSVEREVANLSGGERTLLAFAYRLGLGQLIMQSRTGYGLSLLLLDEPTESLGTEDGSIERLAEAISRFKAIEQTVTVTHSEAFAEKAEHVIRIEKESGESKVSVER